MAQFLQGLDTMGEFYKENATGLGQGIASLAQSKVNKMKKAEQKADLKKGLSAIPGMTPEMADAYTGLPPDLLKELIRSRNGASEFKQQQQIQNQRIKIAPKWNYLEERNDVLDRIGDILDDPDLVLNSAVAGLSEAPTNIGRPLIEKISPKAAELDALSHRLVTLDDEARGKGMRGKYITQQRQKSKIGIVNSLKNNKALLKDYKNSTNKEKDFFTQSYPWFFDTPPQQENLSQTSQPQTQQSQEPIKENGKFYVTNPQTGEKIEVEKDQ